MSEPIDPPDNKSNKRAHLRFVGRLSVKMQVIGRDKEETQHELVVQVVNASFTGAKLSFTKLPNELLKELQSGTLLVRLIVTNAERDETLTLVGGVPVWSSEKVGQMTMGMNWRKGVPDVDRMRLIEWTHASAPSAPPPWHYLAAAGAVGMVVGLVLMLSPVHQLVPVRDTVLAAVRGKPSEIPSATFLDPGTAEHPRISSDRSHIEKDVFAKAQATALVSDLKEGQVVGVYASTLNGNHLEVELAPQIVIPEGKNVYATVAVSDGLGNTILDCTWRDVDFVGEALKAVACDVPAGTVGPLTMSGRMGRLPSFAEAALLKPDEAPLYPSGVQPPRARYAK